MFNLKTISMRNLKKNGKVITNQIVVVDSLNDELDTFRSIAKKHNFKVIDSETTKRFRSDLTLSLQVHSHPTSEANWLLAQVLKKVIH